ncbi:MAG TPA: hypothetical protein VGE42_01135, partial [Candidatus Dormibacteraeota bacterium]
VGAGPPQEGRVTDIDALLDALEKAEARARRALRTVCELEERAAALARMEAAEAWGDVLRQRRRVAEGALDRLDTLRVHARRARG